MHTGLDIARRTRGRLWTRDRWMKFCQVLVECVIGVGRTHSYKKDWEKNFIEGDPGLQFLGRIRWIKYDCLH